MKKSKIRKAGLFIGVSILASAFLTGCTIKELNYQGKVRPVNEIEEMLSDYLESENPDYDLNVEITQSAG